MSLVNKNFTKYSKFNFDHILVVTIQRKLARANAYFGKNINFIWTFS